jgi:hypothetical protein
MIAAAVAGGLFFLNLLWVWLAFAGFAAVLAAGFHFSVDLLLEQQRAKPLAQINGLLKTMRLRGLDEDSIRMFICKYSGNQWEEFYEALFGYEAKMQARALWGRGEAAKPRPKFAVWRDAFVAYVDARQAKRKEARERKMLQRLEEKRLEAEGVEPAKARQKAEKVADNVLDQATYIRQSVAEARGAATLPPGTAAPKSSRRGASGAGGGVAGAAGMDPDSVTFVRRNFDGEAEDESEDRKRKGYIERRFGGWGGFFFGPHVRFGMAVILLAGFALWVHQTNPQFLSTFSQRSGEIVNQTHEELSGEAERHTRPIAVTEIKANDPTHQLLKIPFVPDPVLAIWGSYAAGAMGAMLLFSSFFGGGKMSIFMIPGAIVGLVGQQFIAPYVAHLHGLENYIRPEYVGIAAGGALGALGILFGRQS